MYVLSTRLSQNFLPNACKFEINQSSLLTPKRLLDDDDQVKRRKVPSLHACVIQRWTVPKFHRETCHIPVIDCVGLGRFILENSDPSAFSLADSTNEVYEGRYTLHPLAADNGYVHHCFATRPPRSHGRKRAENPTTQTPEVVGTC